MSIADCSGQTPQAVIAVGGNDRISAILIHCSFIDRISKYVVVSGDLVTIMVNVENQISLFMVLEGFLIV